MSWFKEWFNDLYPVVYDNRTAEEAKQQIIFLKSQLPDISSFSCLDLGCGDGRHLFELGRLTALNVGIDLSKELLGVAKKRIAELNRVYLIRADFRSLPLKSSSFDLATSLFTGFGYLATDMEHLALLKEWRRVLKSGAHFVLDYLDVEKLKHTLIPESHREAGGFNIIERRNFSDDGARIEKSITLTKLESGQTQTFHESVRAYSINELRQLLEKASLRERVIFSDYEGHLFSAGTCRTIAICSAV